jgi:hypothetical protein
VIELTVDLRFEMLGRISVMRDPLIDCASKPTSGNRGVGYEKSEERPLAPQNGAWREHARPTAAELLFPPVKLRQSGA